MARTLLDALAAARRAEPGRPLVTFYDDASGERVELSLTTFDNWVTKVANLFTDEIGTEPGEGLSIALPTHWLAPPLLVGGWVAGLVLTGAAEAAVRVVGPDAAAAGTGGGSAVPTLACSLRPLGGRFVEPLPPGWLDFAVEVPPQPDALLQPQALSPDDPAVAGAASTTHGDLLEAGRRTAAELGLEPGGRLATDLAPADPVGLVSALAAPLAVSASVVLVVNASGERRALIAEQERVTCRAWSD